MTNETCGGCRWWRANYADEPKGGGVCWATPVSVCRAGTAPACRYYQGRLIHQVAEVVEVADEH